MPQVSSRPSGRLAGETPSTPPKAAWARRLDNRVTPYPGSPVKLDFGILTRMLPGLFRAVGDLVADRLAGRESLLVGNMFTAKPNMGVPLGGLGGGSITRGWQGHFVRWQMRPGIHSYREVPADQFSLWVRRDRPDDRGCDDAGSEAGGTGGPAVGGVPEALVLAPRPEAAEGGGLLQRLKAQARLTRGLARAVETWDWGLDLEKAAYHALFPRAWTVYDEPVEGIRLTCRQVSPVIPHNYRESSYPVAVFAWTIENSGSTAADVSLMLSFQNGTGGPNDLAGGHANRLVAFDGGAGGECSWRTRSPSAWPPPPARVSR